MSTEDVRNEASNARKALVELDVSSASRVTNYQRSRVALKKELSRLRRGFEIAVQDIVDEDAELHHKLGQLDRGGRHDPALSMDDIYGTGSGDTDALQAKIDQLTQERDALQQQLDDCRSAQQVDPAELQRLQDEVDRVEHQLEAANQQIAQLEEQLRQCREAREQLQHERDALQTERDGLRQQLDDCQNGNRQPCHSRNPLTWCWQQWVLAIIGLVVVGIIAHYLGGWMFDNIHSHDWQDILVTAMTVVGAAFGFFAGGEYGARYCEQQRNAQQAPQGQAQPTRRMDPIRRH